MTALFGGLRKFRRPSFALCKVILALASHVSPDWKVCGSVRRSYGSDSRLQRIFCELMAAMPGHL